MHPVPVRQGVRRAVLVASFMLFPVTIFYFSPALIVMGAAAGVLNGSALVFLGQFAAALVLGRAFCGWACPAAGLQEACFAARPRRVSGRHIDWIKYALWAPWVGIIAALLVRHGLQGVRFFFLMDSPISLNSPAQYPVYLAVTGLIFVLALAVGRRGFCHAACWMAPFMVAGVLLQRALRLPALRLRAAPDRCTGCRRCTAACPMSLEVEAMVRAGNLAAPECVLCSNCVDGCPHGAIGFAFDRGKLAPGQCSPPPNVSGGPALARRECPVSDTE